MARNAHVEKLFDFRVWGCFPSFHCWYFRILHFNYTLFHFYWFFGLFLWFGCGQALIGSWKCFCEKPHGICHRVAVVFFISWFLCQQRQDYFCDDFSGAGQNVFHGILFALDKLKLFCLPPSVFFRFCFFGGQFIAGL